MKITVFLLLTVLSLPIYGQSDYDSLKAKILKMDIAVNNIHNNMVRSHREFRIGTVVQVGGLGCTLAGLIPRRQDDISLQSKSPGYSRAMVVVGSILMTVGTIIQIDSHKFIGRGGRNKTKRR